MAIGLQKYTVEEAANIQLGQAGYEYVTHGNTTPAIEGGERYVVIISLHSTTLVSCGSDDPAVYPTLTSIPVGEGVKIYGRWSFVTVSSSSGSTGKALIYKG